MEREHGVKGIDGTARLLGLLKCLLFSYILTGGLLLLLALLLYKFELSEQIVSVSIIVIYILAAFFAGFVTGKQVGKQKFLWGLAMGIAYFFILVIVSLLVNHGLKDVAGNFFTVLIICSASGMLGGMLS